MKLLCSILCIILCVTISSCATLLGAKECTRGPAYWCHNITTAASCRAVKHCIQTVWEHQQLPPDNSDVCQICKDMVKQARDQLLSNETQEELKQVFEGSCRLIPLKPVADECCKLADNFIPELVETLASQMNPQVVCSVAGLCNNARIDKMLAESKLLAPTTPVPALRDDCEGCKIVIDTLENRLRIMHRDEVLNRMLKACGRLGSLSDGCSAIMITYFNNIYNYLRIHLKSKSVCHTAGVCSAHYHVHRPVQNVEVIPNSGVGVVKPEGDLPCELCEQLVVHLRDVLIANTTEEEFEQVLEGFCRQTGSFKDECLSLVNEYYAELYNFLVTSLDAQEICKMAGLCGKPNLSQGPVWPLLPADRKEVMQAIPVTPLPPVHHLPASRITPALMPATRILSQEEAKLPRVPLGENGMQVVQDINAAQLPLERIMPLSIVYANNREVCTFCEYFLHFVQEALTNPTTEEKIENIVQHACDKLPASVNAQCKEFVDTYGKAFAALLAQEIDPSQVCPMLGLCPRATDAAALEVMHSVEDKPTCPLCLLAVQEVIAKLKDNKTEENIKHELENLCGTLPQSLAGECRDFVETYSEQLIDMIVADFTPQEVCTYLKLCTSPSPRQVYETYGNEILTNEVPQEELKPVSHKVKADSTGCVICEFVMSKIDDELKDKKTEDDIKNIVHTICNHLPSTVGKECNDFVNQYADFVIALLIQELDPKQVCSEIHLCASVSKHNVLVESIKKNVKTCAVCEATMGALDALLADPTVEKDMGKLLKKVCYQLPQKDMKMCRQLIDSYGPSIMNIISQVADGRIVCMEIGVCSWETQSVHLLGGRKCSWGPAYWCQSTQHANACGTLDHCQEKVWKGKGPTNK